jgi:hypothetical protein
MRKLVDGAARTTEKTGMERRVGRYLIEHLDGCPSLPQA